VEHVEVADHRVTRLPGQLADHFLELMVQLEPSLRHHLSLGRTALVHGSGVPTHVDGCLRPTLVGP
jgi:hypothetical protein